MGGLVFRFSAPDAGTQIGDVRIDRLRLRLTDVRATGDAGPNAATYLDERELELEMDATPEIDFQDAPPGRYSAFEFDLERKTDADAAWELEGEVDLDGETFGLAVDDGLSSSVGLALQDLDLGAGQTFEVSIVVDLAALTEAIDWAAAPVDDGTVVVDDGSPALLAALRTSLLGAFSIESITQID